MAHQDHRTERITQADPATGFTGTRPQTSTGNWRLCSFHKWRLLVDMFALARTIYDLTLIAERALQVNANATTLNVISGIEMLNEPKTTYLNGPITMATLFDFYSRAYTAIRGTGFTGDIWVQIPTHLNERATAGSAE